MNPREREKREASAIVGIFSPEDDDVLDVAQTARAQATQHPSPSANDTAGDEQCPAGVSGGGPATGATGGGGAASNAPYSGIRSAFGPLSDEHAACFYTACGTGAAAMGSVTGQNCCTTYAQVGWGSTLKGGEDAHWILYPNRNYGRGSSVISMVPDACPSVALSADPRYSMQQTGPFRTASQASFQCFKDRYVGKPQSAGPGTQLPGNTPDPPGELILQDLVNKGYGVLAGEIHKYAQTFLCNTKIYGAYKKTSGAGMNSVNTALMPNQGPRIIVGLPQEYINDTGEFDDPGIFDPYTENIYLNRIDLNDASISLKSGKGFEFLKKVLLHELAHYLRHQSGLMQFNTGCSSGWLFENLFFGGNYKLREGDDADGAPCRLGDY